MGLLLVAGGTLFREVGISIGKVEVREKKESAYAMGFLDLFWGTLIFLCIALFIPGSFRFSIDSLPTFIARAILEIIQMSIIMVAVIKADRSTFGFLRTLTIPILLSLDLLLGYTVAPKAMLGMLIIVLTLIVLFIGKGIKKKGVGLVLLTAVGASFTFTLYKYNIEHYNSVVAEQLLIHLILVTFFYFSSWLIAKEHPFHMLQKKIFFAQSFSFGIGIALLSFAFKFAPASIIVAGKRSFAILWTIVSGNKVFHEHHALAKIGAFSMLAVGLFLLI